MSDPTLSWKDLLLGKTNNSSVGTGGGCGKDFEFMEGDFTRTTDMETTVVVKLLGQSIGCVAFQNKVPSLWQPSMFFQLIDVENASHSATEIIGLQSPPTFFDGGHDLDSVVRPSRILVQNGDLRR
ncbi:hypothetical protein Goklo_014597 [Gossypium klotzschianum]|uniref:Uncharacterized protein n=1 Tax=Gossypium klotzschianum TaxID=34286 RepID=A0A7J8U836_9ROSI|nr:hypothetical protein [Gossypium klotzschianum]